MPLTSLLKHHAGVKSLFATVPNFKPHFKTLNHDGIAFPSKLKPSAPCVQGALGSNVGIAYDFVLRANIQRQNKRHQEQDISLPVAAGLRGVRHLVKPKDYGKLHGMVADIWTQRNLYIAGEDDNERQLCEGALILGYLESYYRSQYPRPEGYLKINQFEADDLMQLLEHTKQNPHFFKSEKHLICNPDFGRMSNAVGGADGDYIIDHTLVDIKTVSSFGYSSEYIRQLLGYYILSVCEDSFPVEIHNLAVFFPRFNRYVYISLEQIRQVFDLDNFSCQFIELISLEQKEKTQLKKLFQQKTLS